MSNENHAIVEWFFIVVRLIPWGSFFSKLFSSANNIIDYKMTGDRAFSQIGIETFLIFIVPFLIVMVVVAEYSKKTVVNILTTKISRWQFVSSKYCFLTLLIFLYALFSAIVSVVLFSFAYGWESQNIWKTMGSVIIWALKTTIAQIIQANVIIVLAFVIHNSALIVILFFVFSLVESVVSSILLNIDSPAANIIYRMMPSVLSNSILNTQESISDWVIIMIYIMITVGLAYYIVIKQNVEV